MTVESVPAAQTSNAVALFQRAHGRMTTLQRIDEQIAALLDQRRKVQEELRTVQGLINEEFERVTRASADGAGRMLSQIADLPRGGNGQTSRLDVDATAEVG